MYSLSLNAIFEGVLFGFHVQKVLKSQEKTMLIPQGS